MHVVAPGQRVYHSGRSYGPGEVLPFAPDAALLAAGAVIDAPVAPEQPEPVAAPEPAPKPRKRRSRK
jgi:hypothetical protein